MQRVHTIRVCVPLRRRLGRRSLALRSLRVGDLPGSGSLHRHEPAGSTHEEPRYHNSTHFKVTKMISFKLKHLKLNFI